MIGNRQRQHPEAEQRRANMVIVPKWNFTILYHTSMYSFVNMHPFAISLKLKQ